MIPAGKKNIKIFIGCLLLLVFLIKLTSPANYFTKLVKQSNLLNNTTEEQDNSEKKEETKTGFNYNEWADFFAENHSAHFVYLTICNTYPEYQIDFITTHFPAVITPPPNS